MRLVPMFVILCWIVLWGTFAQAVTLDLTSDATDLLKGDPFDVDLVIAGSELEGDGFSLTGNDLGSFSFTVDYDPTLFRFEGYTLGGHLGFSLDESWGDLSGGRIDLAETSFETDLSFQPDSFVLATVSFTALAEGFGTIGLSDVILGDYWGDPLSPDLPDPLSLHVTAPVPESSTVVLMTAGLLIGVLARRWKRA